jgi:hypothetical protein
VGIFNDALLALDFGLGGGFGLRETIMLHYIAAAAVVLRLCFVLAYEVSKERASGNFESLWSQEAPSSKQLELQVQLH